MFVFPLLNPDSDLAISAYAGALALAGSLIVLTALVLRRLHVPDVIAYVGAGLAVGSFELANDDIAHFLVKIGALTLLFLTGAGMRLERLVQGRKAFRPVFFRSLTIAVAVTSFLIYTGVAPGASVFTGFLASLGGSMMLSARPFGARPLRDLDGSYCMMMAHCTLLLAMLLLLPVLAGVDRAWYATGVGLFMVIAFATVGLIFAHALVPSRIRRATESGSAVGVVLLIIAIVVVVVRLAGGSLAIAAFLAGLMLSGSYWRSRPMDEVITLRGPARAVLFVGLGLLVDPRFVAENAVLLLSTAGALLAVRVLAMRVFQDARPISRRRSVLMLAPLGELSILLFYEASAVGLSPAGLAAIGEAGFVTVVVLTACFMAIHDRMSARVFRSGRALRKRVGLASARGPQRISPVVPAGPTGYADLDGKISLVEGVPNVRDTRPDSGGGLVPIIDRTDPFGPELTLVTVQSGAPGCLKSARELALWECTGLVVPAAWRGDVCFLLPNAEYVFQPGDRILLSGSAAMLQTGTRLFGRMPSSAPPGASSEVE